MMCATCNLALCGCSDAAWAGAVAPVPAGAIDMGRYFHAALGIALVGLVSSGKGVRFSRRSRRRLPRG